MVKTDVLGTGKLSVLEPAKIGTLLKTCSDGSNVPFALKSTHASRRAVGAFERMTVAEVGKPGINGLTVTPSSSSVPSVSSPKALGVGLPLNSASIKVPKRARPDRGSHRSHPSWSYTNRARRHNHARAVPAGRCSLRLLRRSLDQLGPVRPLS